MKKIAIIITMLALLSVNAFGVDFYAFIFGGYQGEFSDSDYGKRDIHSISLGFKGDIIFGHNLGMFFAFDTTISPKSNFPIGNFKNEIRLGEILDIGLLFRIPASRKLSFLFGAGGFMSGTVDWASNGFFLGLFSGDFGSGSIYTFTTGVSAKIDMNYQITEALYLRIGFTGRFILFKSTTTLAVTTRLIAEDTKISGYTGYTLNPYFAIGWVW